MATNRRALRERWFDAGASAVARVSRGEVVGSYWCPLCLDAFERDGAVDGTTLTVEDVPPKSLGGVPLALTCARCNHTQGSTIDSQAERRDRVERLMGGQLSEDERVKGELVSADGKRLALEFRHGPEGEMVIRTDSRWGTPGVVADLEDAVLQRRDEPLEVRFNLPGWHPKASNLTWMRAAYLVAFASTGYRYILSHPALETLRQQLSDRDATLMPDTVLRRTATPEDQRLFMLMKEPSELAGSFLVMFGSRAVVLPGVRAVPWTFENTHDVLEAFGKDREMSGAELEWATEARYLTDADNLK